MDKQPKTIFEQILFGLEATNTNVVDLSEEIAAIRREIQEIKSALFVQQYSEPNVLGAAEDRIIEGTNL